MNNKLFLFDADETLWHSVNKDYISSQTSKLDKLDSLTVARQIDNQKFYLDKEVTCLFKKIVLKGYCIGVVSDNKKFMVVNTLKLLGLWQYIDKKAVNIKLWQGYCPKHLMVQEIIIKMGIDESNSVYWFDDKNYIDEAKTIGVNFFHINQSVSLSQAVLSVL